MVQPPDGRHGPTREEAIDERLETQKLLDNAAALCASLDVAHVARWSKATEWTSFLDSIEAVALGLDKLGDGRLASQRRIRESKQRTGAARSPADAERTGKVMLLAQEPREPARYTQLLALLQDAEAYTPIRVLDSHMGLNARLVRTPKNIRRTFYKDMSFTEFPVMLYTFAQGGPYPSTAYVWRVTEPLDLTLDGAAHAKAVAGAPSFSSRAMEKEFFSRFSVLGTSKVALRAMYRHIAPETVTMHDAYQEALDMRLLGFLAQRETVSPAMFQDLRALNGPAEAEKFLPFWDELGAYLQLEVGESAEQRRHSPYAISYASKVVSIPVLVREVAKRLHAKDGHTEDPIPHKEVVRLQFTPSNRQKLTSSKFSARFKIIRKVQTRSLRKEHEDAHWVAALSKYNKTLTVTINELAKELGLLKAMVSAGLDDKCQIPTGLPGLPINSGARAQGPVLAGGHHKLPWAAVHCQGGTATHCHVTHCSGLPHRCKRAALCIRPRLTQARCCHPKRHPSEGHPR